MPAQDACRLSSEAWDLYLDVFYATKLPPAEKFTQFYELRSQALGSARIAAQLNRRWSPLAHLVAPSWDLTDSATGDAFSQISNWCVAESL